MQNYSIDELCAVGETLTHAVGESVWDLSLCVDGKTVMYAHHWTSQLSRDSTWLRLGSHDYDAIWRGAVFDTDEIRLFLRDNESFSLESRTVRSVTANSQADAFWSFLRLPSQLWWVASFVCPFCSKLCRGVSDSCEHQLIAGGRLCSSFHGTLPRLKQLCDDMCELNLLGDFVNVQLEGIVVKTARNPLPREWFRQAYVYSNCIASAEALEAVVLEQACITKRSTRSGEVGPS
jgi:hypothetical protein